MRSQIEGSRAVAHAVNLCRPEVIAAYPISPQTHIVESLSDRVRTGELASCQYMMVESEFGAMSACIGASGAGARTYAVIKLGKPGEAYPIDLDYCKGCGLCVAECPSGAIQMFPEEI